MKKAFIYFNLLTPIIVFAQDEIIVDKSLNKNDIIIDKSSYQDAAIASPKDKILKKSNIVRHTNQALQVLASTKSSVQNPGNTSLLETLNPDSINFDSEQIYMIELNKQWNFVASLVNSDKNILISKEYIPDDLLSALNESALTKINEKDYLIINQDLILKRDDNNY